MGKRVLLTEREISRVLKVHEKWSCNQKKTKLYRTFVCDSYVDALVFIARISVHAEVLQHHPEILFTYTKVKITLTTHELGGVTKLDVSLLERIEKLAQKSA